MMPSLFGALRLLGWSATTSIAVHMAVAVPMLALTLLCVSIHRSPRFADILVPIATFVIMPYALSYDFGAASVALALFIRNEEAAGRPFQAGEQRLLALAMLLPLIMIGIGILTRVDIAPLVLVAVLLLIVNRTGTLTALQTQLARGLRRRPDRLR